MAGQTKQRLISRHKIVCIQCKLHVEDWKGNSNHPQKVPEPGQCKGIASQILQNPLAVSIGAILGHSLCTAMAVMGGRLVAQQISVRTVTIIGAVVFISFGIANLLLPIEADQ